MRVEQEVGRHHDGGEHIVEIVRDAAGKLADQLHLLLLRDFIFEFALRRGFERIDDGRFLVALLFLDRGDIETAEPFAVARERRIDRCDVAVAKRGLRDRRGERLAVAFDDRGEDRAVLPLAAARAVEQAREQRIGAHHAAMLVDGRDRHRRVMEEPHEADFGGALRIGAVVAGAVEHQRARRAGRAVGAIGELMKHSHRQRASAAGAQIEVEHLSLDLAGRRPQRRQQSRAVAGDQIGDLQARPSRPGRDPDRANWRAWR